MKRRRTTNDHCPEQTTADHGGRPDLLVAVITHVSQRLLNLAAAIRKHRQQPVIYYLALWGRLVDSKDALLALAWAILTPDSQLLGEKPKERQSLLPVSR